MCKYLSPHLQQLKIHQLVNLCIDKIIFFYIKQHRFKIALINFTLIFGKYILLF